ncbi:methyltransferase, FxLD system [Nonomuraea jabiensis]|uniref:methyltransferase, FxLD system n=1 Tax=Nonomuraea jabiensis TaxID=882448 RepID=UPI003D71EE0D
MTSPETWTDRLRPHQLEAVAQARKAFAAGDRATQVLSCGAGKTRIGAAVAATLTANGLRLVLAPTVMLLAQLLREYRLTLGDATLGTVLVVCSDHDAAERAGVDELQALHVVTTDAAVIAAAASQPGPVTMLSTYASVATLSRAHHEHAMPPVDILIAEAHRTVSGLLWRRVAAGVRLPLPAPHGPATRRARRAGPQLAQPSLRHSPPTRQAPESGPLPKEVIVTAQNITPSTQASTPGGAASGEAAETSHDTGLTIQRLRSAFADRLCQQGIVRTPAVEDALRAVPRHPFMPGVPLEQVYAIMRPHTTGDSVVTSSIAAEPALAALLLEQAQVQPGMRVLEIGATTGYAAALLAHLVGEHGHVTTVNTDADVVRTAIAGLAETGSSTIRVVSSQAAVGYADGAPYDRLIIADATWDVPPAWLPQISPNGRLVMPLRLRGSMYRLIGFDRTNDHWTAQYCDTAAFMPPQDRIADDPLRLTALNETCTVTLHLHQDQQVDAVDLLGVLDRKRSEVWTGVRIPRDAGSIELLHLYLACAMEAGLSRMTATTDAITTATVTPPFEWGAMAVPGDGDLAYITLRPTAASELMYDIGVIGHGRDGYSLATHVADAICLWAREYRENSVRIGLQRADACKQIDGQFVFDRPNSRLVIDWE